jgi:hypothetical protein
VRKNCPDSDMQEAVEAVFVHPSFERWAKEAHMLVYTKITRQADMLTVVLVVGIWELLRVQAPLKEVTAVAAISEALSAAIAADCAKDLRHAHVAVDICRSEAVWELCTTPAVVDIIVKTLHDMLFAQIMPLWSWWQQQHSKD